MFFFWGGTIRIIRNRGTAVSGLLSLILTLEESGQRSGQVNAQSVPVTSVWVQSQQCGTKVCDFFVMDLVQRTQCHNRYISISFNIFAPGGGGFSEGVSHT